jgi:DNA-binding transcriptional ArsR family regulator
MRVKMTETDVGCAPTGVDAMAARASDAAAFLKALSHEGRLMILCHIADHEKTVTELEQLLDMRQAAVSQQLARLREEGLVSTRRDGKAIYYAIEDAKVRATVALMYQLFCGPNAARPAI